MATKKPTYIDVELNWAEEQLATWKTYIDDHPIADLRHEQVGKAVVTIQQQGTFIQNTMKNYLALLQEVGKMREAEAAKVESRGKGEISHLAQEFLGNRK